MSTNINKMVAIGIRRDVMPVKLKGVILTEGTHKTAVTREYTWSAQIPKRSTEVATRIEGHERGKPLVPDSTKFQFTG